MAITIFTISIKFCLCVALILEIFSVIFCFFLSFFRLDSSVPPSSGYFLSNSKKTLPYSWRGQKLHYNVRLQNYQDKMLFRNVHLSDTADNSPDDKIFQSPINIPCECCSKTWYFTKNEILQLQNFNSADVTITNTGHTLKCSQAQSASITGGPLKKTYNFVQLHFHWGCTDSEGSDHQIADKNFSMEAHFVFSRSYVPKLRKRNDCTSKIKSIKPCDVEAETERRTESNANVGDKFRKRNTHSKNTVTINVVLGVLFDASEDGTRYDVLEMADKLVDVNNTITENGQFICQFMPSMNLDNYFTYSGSLTTPPYTTNVIWIVLGDPLTVCSDQLVLLRNLHSDHGGLITENFRDLQPLCDRVVCHRQRVTNPESC